MKKKKSLPRLSPPWNVGFLASLFVVLVSLGVGFYVTFYALEMTTQELWEMFVDPTGPQYFTRAFPLQAGLLLVAVCCYLVFTNALRRYKRWVDSGQDYRLLIQKARSLEDLTSPASIAKFIDFPEFQAILRAWADRMRAAATDGSPLAPGPGPLEDVSFESLPGGASPSGPSGAQTQASAVEALGAAVQGLADPRSPLTGLTPPSPEWQALTDSIQGAIESHRHRIGQDSSLFDRLAESLERLCQQVDSLHERFDSVSTSLGPLAETCIETMGQMQEGGEGKGLDGRTAEGLHKVINAMRMLAERNEKIALSMALEASKGSCSEQAFSAAADEVRKLAEKFKTLAGMTEPVLEKIQAVGESTGAGGLDRDTVESILMAVEEGVGRFKSASMAMSETVQAVHDALSEMRGLLDGRNAEAGRSVEELITTSGAEPVLAGAVGGGAEMSMENTATPMEWGTIEIEGGTEPLPGQEPSSAADEKTWDADSFSSLELDETRADEQVSSGGSSTLESGTHISLGEPQEGAAGPGDSMEGPLDDGPSAGAPSAQAQEAARTAEHTGAARAEPAGAKPEGTWIGFSTPDEGGDEPVHDLVAIGAVELD